MTKKKRKKERKTVMRKEFLQKLDKAYKKLAKFNERQITLKLQTYKIQYLMLTPISTNCHRCISGTNGTFSTS